MQIPLFPSARCGPAPLRAARGLRGWARGLGAATVRAPRRRPRSPTTAPPQRSSATPYRAAAPGGAAAYPRGELRAAVGRQRPPDALAAGERPKDYKSRRALRREEAGRSGGEPARGMLGVVVQREGGFPQPGVAGWRLRRGAGGGCRQPPGKGGLRRAAGSCASTPVKRVPKSPNSVGAGGI